IDVVADSAGHATEVVHGGVSGDGVSEVSLTANQNGTAATPNGAAPTPAASGNSRKDETIN
ncbi:hypothetical protein ACP3WY_25625, partial [Salmonella enterica]|uniref:hypothetical protein n=1 Tax=Salmonella enterica TaxID=28901 RepID=UPI003CFAFE70